jgi:L-ascorbate metabolism protein UlaG (beta-lactamase superfamily)
MKLRWLGTAGFELISDSGTILLIDPYLSRPPLARPRSSITLSDISQADAIFVSHGHFDHALDVPSLAERLNTMVYASASVCQTLARHGTKPLHLTSLNPGETVWIKDLRVRSLAAQHIHFDARLLLCTLPHVLPHLKSLCPLFVNWPAGQILAFQIISPDFNLLHFGSAGLVPEGLQADVALIPLQGRSDIVEVATQMAASLQPRWVVPHHWDDFYPPISQLVPVALFAKALSRDVPQTRLHVPIIGQAWRMK